MFRLPATLGHRPLALDLVVAFVGQFLAADGSFRDATVTAFSEAFNAVVRRAYEGRSDGMVDVEIELGTTAITLRFHDDGLVVDFTRPPPPPLDDMPAVRLGTFLIHATVDEVAYQPGARNVLTLIKRLHSPGQ
jgi:anti-sigma regulatory factor (Ser/Thr protein kinase)